MLYIDFQYFLVNAPSKTFWQLITLHREHDIRLPSMWYWFGICNWDPEEKLHWRKHSRPRL